MPAMSQTTTMLLWVHWIQFAAERIALLGSGLFAGAQLYRSMFAHPRLIRAGITNAVQGFRDDTPPADGLLAGVAATTALAAMLACLAGTGVMSLVAGLADGLAAVYLLTEVSHTRSLLRTPEAGSVDESAIKELLARWQGQQVWLAATAACAQLLLVLRG